MNWFQIVFLREQSQVRDDPRFFITSCELISNCIFTWAITSKRNWCKVRWRLWIDFKLYFYVSNHKIFGFIGTLIAVVNWFQIVFLREQSQGISIIYQMMDGCELISNCIFTWAITSSLVKLCVVSLLWIDFKLYFYVSNHKVQQDHGDVCHVVNWFQIVFLREQSQV